MRKMGIVLKYELREYFASKGFMAFTLLLAIGAAVLLFLPRFVDMSSITGVQIVGKDQGDTGGDTATDTDGKQDQNKDVYLYLDQAGVVREEVLRQMFPEQDWQAATDKAALIAGVENQEAVAGFVVTGSTSYDYYVYNKAMTDTNTAIFDQAMKQFYRMDYCDGQNLDLAEITAMYDVPITIQEQILNKDTSSNFWYCYFLVIIVFMLIVMYGQMIAVSVTSEKSNRAIEVLVTSTSSNSLLFGKVIAGAIGGLFQTGVVLGAVLLSYQLNRQQWGGMLDMLLHIPGEVLVTFAVFGMGGYLFYAFLYGAMGGSDHGGILLLSGTA